MNLRDASKSNYSPEMGAGTYEEINCGSLQRIADAMDKMASSYDRLREERDRYEQWYRDRNLRVEELERQVAALRGVITKLRNKGATE